MVDFVGGWFRCKRASTNKGASAVMLRIVRYLTLLLGTLVGAYGLGVLAVNHGLIPSAPVFRWDIVQWLMPALLLTLTLLLFAQAILLKRAERLPPLDDATFHA